MNAWLAQHQAALASAFQRLWSTPLNTLLSLLVIGIALTLPGAGYLLLDNLRDLGRNASGVQQISLFMNIEASKKDVGDIEARLRSAASGRWKFVSKEEALKRMQKSEGMAEIVASLPRNPLPDAFIVEPTNSEPEALEILRKEIASWPKVAHVQLDSAWVKRFVCLSQARQVGSVDGSGHFCCRAGRRDLQYHPSAGHGAGAGDRSGAHDRGDRCLHSPPFLLFWGLAGGLGWLVGRRLAGRWLGLAGRAGGPT
jgi:hypothetical protein